MVGVEPSKQTKEPSEGQRIGKFRGYCGTGRVLSGERNFYT